MSMPRRHLIRPTSLPTADPHQQHKVQRLRSRLDHERTTLARWQKRLKRAFNTVEKCNQLIARLERQLAQMEE
jgi:septal ring factor EnvC (AmiA/AmiB activator)